MLLVNKVKLWKATGIHFSRKNLGRKPFSGNKSKFIFADFPLL